MLNRSSDEGQYLKQELLLFWLAQQLTEQTIPILSHGEEHWPDLSLLKWKVQRLGFEPSRVPRGVLGSVTCLQGDCQPCRVVRTAVYQLPLCHTFSLSVCYWESHIFMLHVVGKEQGRELDDVCSDCSETFLGQSFTWSMFSPSLAVSFSVSLCPSSPTLSPATTKLKGKTHITYLGFVGFILVLPWGTRLIVRRQ